MIDQFKRYFIAEKLKSVFTLVIEYSGGIGTYQSVVEYIYCWIPGTIGWSIGRKDDACQKKEKNSLDM